MKQGTASSSRSGSTKTEPRSHAINPAAVADIGIQQVRTRSIPFSTGPGLSAPMAGTDTHPHGSQGKHK